MRDKDGLIGEKVLRVKHTIDKQEVCVRCRGGECKPIPNCHTVLISPQQKAVWGNTLKARNWTNTGAVRGVAGIHAVWPVNRKELLEYIDSDTVLVELRGFGDTVQGDLGWRAECAMIVKIYAHPGLHAALSKTYDAELLDIRRELLNWLTFEKFKNLRCLLEDMDINMAAAILDGPYPRDLKNHARRVFDEKLRQQLNP